MNRSSLSLLIVLFAGAAVPAAALAQDPGLPSEDPRNRPAPRPNFTNRVNLMIERVADQTDPILERSMFPKFQLQDNGNEVLIDARTYFRMPDHDPSVTMPTLSVRLSSLKFAALGGAGIANRIDPGTFSQPPPFIPVQPPQGGNDQPPPPPTKPLFVSGSGSTSVSDSDTPMMAGPEIDMALIENLDHWRPLRWLPEGSAFHLYGRIQFGTLEVFHRQTSVQMYSMGPRLALPFYRTDSFELNACIFAGAGFVKTSIGDATGFDGGLGVSAVRTLGAGVSLYGSVEAELFLSKGTSAFGPAFNLGLNVGF